MRIRKQEFFFSSQIFELPLKKSPQSTKGFPDGSVGRKSICNAVDTGLIPESGRSAGEGIGYPLQYSWASLVGQLVKNLSAMQETWVLIPGLGRSLGEEKGYPLQSSGLENSMDYTVHGVAKIRTGLSGFHSVSKRREDFYFTPTLTATDIAVTIAATGSGAFPRHYFRNFMCHSKLKTPQESGTTVFPILQMRFEVLR